MKFWYSTGVSSNGCPRGIVGKVANSEDVGVVTRKDAEDADEDAADKNEESCAVPLSREVSRCDDEEVSICRGTSEERADIRGPFINSVKRDTSRLIVL